MVEQRLDSTRTSGLLSGWEVVTLGEVCQKPQYGYTTKAVSSGKIKLLRTTDITSGQVDWDGVPYCAEEPKDASKYLLQDNDIVVSRAGSVGVSHLIRQPQKAVFASYLIRFLPYIDPQYVQYFLQSPSYWTEISENKMGIAVPNVNATKLSNIRIPVAPLNEQRRIVAKIEELFSELGNGVESLKTARAQLQTYRQSLLKAAFEGRLTEQWRQEKSTSKQSPESLLKYVQHVRYRRLCEEADRGDAEAKRFQRKVEKHTPEHPGTDSPDGSIWVSLLEIGQMVVDCHNKTAPYEDDGVLLIRTPCVRDGKINFDEEIRYVSEETYDYWSRRCPPRPGDIIFTREAPMGEAGIIPEGVRLCMGQRMMLIRPPEGINAKYLLYCLLEPGFQERMTRKAIGTGVKHLRVGDVENLCIPLFALEEQNKIVEELDAKLSSLESIEETVQKSLERTEGLRQSILKCAFEGKLVPQDPNDEPASTLLERIRQEQGDQPERRRGSHTAGATA